MKKKYRIASFFAGIGGFDIAFERESFKTTFLCEINDFCSQVLNKHWPNVTKFTDINQLSADEIPEAEVWCGGFPCQDISVARGASQRLGLGGERSGLFYKYAKLISEKKPKVVIIENVEGLFNSNKGRDFGVILQTLDSLGYAVAWRMLNSRYFGVPQSRTRVYLCCWLNDPTKAMNVMFDKEGAEKPKGERADFITEESAPDSYPKVPKVAYCLAASSGRHTGTDWSRTYVVCEEAVRRLTPMESERLQGFPDNWTNPSNGMADENINTLRYTAIGNAVSVPVIEWIAKRVYNGLEAKSGDAVFSPKTFIPEMSKSEWKKDYISGTDFSDEEIEHKWAKGGIVWNGSYIECAISPTPNKIVRSSLLKLIEPIVTSPIYYLTPNAAEGILRRVDKQGRTLFAPLRTTLEYLRTLNTHE